MEQSEEQFWDHKHHDYATKSFVKKPNWLARILCDNNTAPTQLLDLGCGQGQDSVYFSDQGFSVTAVDFSAFALQQFASLARDKGIRQERLNLAETPYPLESAHFDIVYAHLTLHYFSLETTRSVFAEAARVLKPDGQFWALFNSDHDPEATDASAQVIEDRFLELAPGSRKRYFTPGELPDLLGDSFEVQVARYGHGTTKSEADEYVELVATKKGV